MAELDRMRDRMEDIRREAVARWQRRREVRARNEERLAAGGAGAADSPQRQARFAARAQAFESARRLRAVGGLPLGLERKIGPTLDYTPFAPSDAARLAGRPVARIVQRGGPGTLPEGYATGFLCGQNLLLTNHHVFPTRGDTMGAAANFLFEKTDRGVQQGQLFELDPARFYFANERLDFALVAVAPQGDAGATLADFGSVALVEATPKILIGQPVNIIQHPEGGPKQYATTQNRLVDVLDEGFLHYETDTLPGSSGSPAFSIAWELVALHHTAIPLVRNGRYVAKDGGEWTRDMDEDDLQWVANEGTRVSAIIGCLNATTLPDPAQQDILRRLLAMTTDPADEIARGAATVPTTPMQPLVAAGGVPGFVFTGPVTINIVSSAPPAAPAPAVALPPPALPPAAAEASIVFDRNYRNREGYAPDFLGDGLHVPTPGIAATRAGEILLDEEDEPLVLKYHHFELVMNRERRLQMWSAANVDYDPARKSDKGREAFGRDRWIPDPRIPEALQIMDAELYKPAGNIDRGHIVRREDNAWGDSPREIEFANSDTFHWTNCTPQHEAFNQSTPGRNDRAYRGMEGLWGGLENHIQRQLGMGETRACILAGPVLAPNDPEADFGAGPIAYPLRFWKVVCVPLQRGGQRVLGAFGFILSQKPVVDKFGIEEFGPGKFRRYQVRLSRIEREAGVTFDAALHAADTMPQGRESLRIATPAQVQGLPGVAAEPAEEAEPVA
jgi:endonuclease G